MALRSGRLHVGGAGFSRALVDVLGRLASLRVLGVVYETPLAPLPTPSQLWLYAGRARSRYPASAGGALPSEPREGKTERLAI